MSSFHYDFILSKRSSLAKVWLAAHWEKKLSKVQVFEANLQSIVKDILNPKTPIALRTSSHLLVGLVRIYSRKAKYLLKDCSDTLVNIKVAFRPGLSALDKPSKKRKSVKEIMDCPLFITEKVDLLDQWIPEVGTVEIDCTLNQSKVEEITLQEEPMKMNSLEDYFDDEGFGEMDIDVTKDLTENCGSVMERVYSFADSAYGETIGETFSLTDCSDPFSSLTPAKDVNSSSPSKPTTSRDQLPKLLLGLDEEFHPERNEAEDTLILELDPALQDGSEENTHRRLYEECETQAFEDTHSPLGPDKRLFESRTEISEGILVLDPIENTQKELQSSRKRRKRKLLIDEVISIERAVIFDNLNNPSQLLKQPLYAPKTKRQMKQAENNASLLLKESSFLELPPSLKVLFHHTKCRKLSFCSDFSDDINSSCEKNSEQDVDIGSQMNEPGELDVSARFIPLQDVEYSSDEENTVHQDENLTDLCFTQNAEETEDILMDENISEDKFCSFVETTVLQSQPRAVKFQEIVGGDGKPVTRKIVARRFVKCLIMQRDSRLVLEQDGCFNDIFLHPGLKHAAEKTDV